MRNISLQMYTVRTALAADPGGTLDAVAAAGYTAVELFGASGAISPMQLYPRIKQLGLRVSSGHISPPTLADEAVMKQTASEYAAMGAQYLALAWLPPESRTLEGFHKTAQQLTRAAKITADHGLKLCYHNHDFEFARLPDGRTGLDVLMAETARDQVQFELDLYWVAKAGVDVIATLRSLTGRVPLVHVKDMTKDDTRNFEIVGEGQLDFGTILPEAQKAGAQWYIIEQDQCPQGEIESVKRSLKNMHARGWS